MPLPTALARRLVALAGLVSAAALAACGTGVDAQTNEIYNPAVGVNDRGGGVDVLNLLAVANTDGTGTVSAALLNQGEESDELTEITVADEGEELTVDASGLPLELESGQLVNVEKDAEIYVEDVHPGHFLTMDLTFANAEPVQLDVPVVERISPTDMYSSVPSGSGPPVPTETESTESESGH